MSYVTWDCETTTHTSFKRKANPFDKANHVVTHGFKHKGETGVTEVRFGRERPGHRWLAPILHPLQEGGFRTKLIFGFNIKFDLLHALQDPGNMGMWMDYVAGGGNVWDCQLAEYLLNGMVQSEHMVSLDEVAPRYGGNVKVDEVKALWKAGVQTYDIEPELLSRYLCGGDNEHGVFEMGDVENTELIALAQIKRARDCGQLNSILLNMGALLYTVEAERNGMYVDKARGLTLAAALQIAVDAATAGLVQYIPADTPFDFNWGSPRQRSALFFGGTVQYDAYEWDTPDGGVQNVEPSIGKGVYAQKDSLHYVLENGGTYNADYYDLENFNGTPDLPHRLVIKSGKNAGEFKTKKVKENDHTKPKGRACKLPYTFAGYIKPQKKWEGADPGVYSTAADVILELAESGVPFLKVYADLMSMSKDLGTYYIKTDEHGVQTGMLTLVGEDGLIHHMLNMVSTVTARLSSSNPNLQNIPKGNKSDIKTTFISRFENGVIIQSDFSSLEIYVQANMTLARKLIEDLKSGMDLHCVRLSQKEHMDYDEVLKLCKGYTDADGVKHDADKAWDYKRTGAKTFSFQRAYGAGVAKISSSTGMTVEETQALADAEDARYPEIPAYYTEITAAIKGNRRPSRTLPHPEMPGVMCNIGTSFYRTPDGKLYAYTEQPSPEYLVRRGVTASFSPTEIRNYVVQGMGGEWMKAAMWLMVRAFYKRRNFDGLALIVNTVHDASYVDADASVKLNAAALVHACMELSSDFMEWWFKWTIAVPVPSDTSWGSSMADEEKIPGLKELAAPLRVELRSEYLGGYVPSYLQ